MPAAEKGFRFALFLALVFLVIPGASLWLMEGPVRRIATSMSSPQDVSHVYELDEDLYSYSIMIAFPLGILPCLLVQRSILSKRMAVAAWAVTVPLLEFSVVLGKLLVVCHQ